MSIYRSEPAEQQNTIPVSVLMCLLREAGWPILDGSRVEVMVTDSQQNVEVLGRELTIANGLYMQPKGFLHHHQLKSKHFFSSFFLLILDPRAYIHLAYHRFFL
jgi:hypothetical protein